MIQSVTHGMIHRFVLCMIDWRLMVNRTLVGGEKGDIGVIFAGGGMVKPGRRENAKNVKTALVS